MPIQNIFCDPSGGVSDQSVRSSSTGAATAGSISGNCAAILGGILAAAPTNSNDGDLSVIVMGDTNCICQNSFAGPTVNGCLNAIVNGCFNTVCGCHASIFSGCTNNVGGYFSSVFNGQANVIASTLGPVSFSSIAGGSGNGIGDNTIVTADCSFVGGGMGNHVYGAASSIVGGLNLHVCSQGSFLAGGNQNNIFTGSDCSSIVGGSNNSIGSTFSASGATYSFLGGGQLNCIDDSTGATTFGVIGGGCHNWVCAGTNYSSIFSGQLNCVSGNYSSILGGYNNNDGGFNCVGMYGSGLSGLANNTFYLNCLNIASLPTSGAGLNPGDVWKDTSTSPATLRIA